MARYIGSACALCRREGEKLYLKGDRCYTPKCAIEKRGYPPGQHGPTGGGRRKVSDYSLQLREKQKARRIYGVMERQFRRYFAEAAKAKGVTGATLLQYLESRLDNIVYRMGFAASRRQARQLVRHGHFAVNGKLATTASMLLKPDDTVSVIEKSRKSIYFQDITKEFAQRPSLEWLTLDAQNLSGKVMMLPSRKHIDVPLQEQLIVEYYSR